MFKSGKIKKNIFVVFLFIISCPGLGAGNMQNNNNQVLLGTILKNSARYCERLKEAVFHFFCQEVVTEKIEKKLNYPENRRGLKDFFEGNSRTRSTDYQYEAHKNAAMRRLRDNFRKLKGGMKTFFTYDYQIIQVEKEIREQRVLLKVEKDKQVYQKSNYNPILYSYKNALVPIHFFSVENQPRFIYKLSGKKRALKRKAYNILVFRDEKPEAGPMASVWIDQEDFSIIKFEVFPGAIRGYNQLLRVNREKMSKIDIRDVHVFGLLKDGIRYPTRTEIRLSYQSELKNVIKKSDTNGGVTLGAIVLTKIQTLIKYTDYRFFKVNVDRPVFKKVH